ncbi:hypothetical protein R5R35_006296 [Gryllus longicercus]|uniref:Uncharacterized protein n=1 Tax=Gryllus longicercus TaxID=2509291 RepID=A0AAN9ZGH9_9ORTH
MNSFYMYVLTTLLVLNLINFGNGLECYVCDRQEDNKGKCLQTIKTCEQEEDVCLSEIAWGSTPYWSHHAEKQYYISKRCAKKEVCERTRSKLMPYCTHIWYEDWKCSECCQGDRCNYYVILSGSLAKSSMMVVSVCLASVLLFRRAWHT